MQSLATDMLREAEVIRRVAMASTRPKMISLSRSAVGTVSRDVQLELLETLTASCWQGKDSLAEVAVTHDRLYLPLASVRHDDQKDIVQ